MTKKTWKTLTMEARERIAYSNKTLFADTPEVFGDVLHGMAKNAMD